MTHATDIKKIINEINFLIQNDITHSNDLQIILSANHHYIKHNMICLFCCMSWSKLCYWKFNHNQIDGIVDMLNISNDTITIKQINYDTIIITSK